MRVTFVCPPFALSGGDKVIATYARHLHARGHEVLVICPDRRPISLRRRLSNFLAGRKPYTRKSPTDYYDGTGPRFHMLERYRPVVDADLPDADILISTWWETSEWAERLSPAKGRHVQFIQHYEAFSPQTRDRVDAVLRLPTLKITISKWLETLLRETFGNTRVVMIPNSVDTKQFDAPPRGRHAVPTVGMVYSPIPWKNCQQGIRAFEALRGRVPGVRLRTFGANDPWPSVPLPADAVHTTLPPQDSIRDIYAECDVWLCTSQTEGFGLPVLEAMACRCPVVSTPVGGPIDLIREGENGFLVPVDDIEATAARLEQVLTCPEAEWQRMSDAAHRTATGYSWDDAADRFEAALERVAAGE